MESYFVPDSATYKIIEVMRKGILDNKKVGFPDEVIRKARKEVQRKRKELDESAYEFAYSLNNEVFGRFNKGRVVMLVNGRFIGIKEDADYRKSEPDREEGYTIPIDLGTNPHSLFEDIGTYPTIDAKVTEEKTQQFLGENRQYLRGMSMEGFIIDSSRFFYFDDAEVSEGFSTEGGVLDMQRLVPLITELPLYLFANGEIRKSAELIPSAKDYGHIAIRFVSYRLKQSETKKLADKLTYSPGEIGEEKVIVDWVAHRLVLREEEDVHAVEDFLRGNPTIGDPRTTYSRIKHKHTDNYYAEPKPNGFRNMNVSVEVRTKGFKPCVREIQIVDLTQFYPNEINIHDPRHHKQQKKRREHVSKRKSELKIHYEGILQQIFGKDLIFIKI